jgi:hypothetical protein
MKEKIKEIIKQADRLKEIIKLNNKQLKQLNNRIIRLETKVEELEFGEI